MTHLECQDAAITDLAPLAGLSELTWLGLRDRLLFDEVTWGASDTDLIDYALASPNQYDAGTCLYMSNTGVMELLVNQRLPLEQVEYQGESDFSERCLMNAHEYAPNSSSRLWLTDVVYTYNRFGGSLLFLDPDENQWGVALRDGDHVERIESELRTENAPVIVVYNHYLYWHADIVVGSDDSVETDGCPMVESSVDYCEDNHFASSARAIERSYDWVRFLGNHVYTVQRQ